MSMSCSSSWSAGSKTVLIKLLVCEDLFFWFFHVSRNTVLEQVMLAGKFWTNHSSYVLEIACTCWKNRLIYAVFPGLKKKM